MIKRQDLVKKLQQQTANYFKEKGFDTTKRGYILEKHTDWQNNIILKEVADYICNQMKHCEENKIPFPLHTYIHHGLSSQACLFNLLGPLLVSEDYATLKEIILLSGLNLAGNVSRANLEFENRAIFNENRGQPTSVDLFIETNKNEKVFVEFKFTESEFGTCSVYEAGDCDGSNPKGNLAICYLHTLVYCP